MTFNSNCKGCCLEKSENNDICKDCKGYKRDELAFNHLGEFPGLVRLLNEIYNFYIEKEELCESYREDIKELEKKTVNDTTKELEKENDYLRKHSLEVLTDKELKAIEKFREKHYNSCKKGKNYGAIGYDEYIYSIAGTGLGTCIKIKCPVCGKELDVTDESKF